MRASTKKSIWISCLQIVCLQILAIAVVQTSGPTEAFAQDVNEARNHYRNGVSLFDRGEYNNAIAEFTAADRIAPSAVLDYNIGLCHERLGQNAEATTRYRSYLNRSPSAANRSEVEDKIRRLEQIERDAAAAPPVTPAPSSPGSPPATVPAKPPNSGAAPASPGTGAFGPSAAPTYAPTGDPELDRVAGVNLNSVAGQHPSVVAQAPNTNSPSPMGAGVTAIDPATGQPTGQPTAAPTGADEPKPKPSKPIYKRWWFWVVVGVSAIILIDIASDDSGNENNRLILDPSVGASQPAASSGFTLRF